MDNFRKNFSALMDKRNLSNRQMSQALKAKGLKVDRNKVGHWREGAKDWWPNIKELWALAELLEVDLGTLLGADLATAKRTATENDIIRYSRAVGYQKALRLLYDAIPKPKGGDPRFLPDKDSDLGDG